MSEPVTAENAHRAEQPMLPLMWTAAHTHPHLQGALHQHFDNHDQRHPDVPLVPFEPERADFDQKATALEILRSSNRARHAALTAQGVQIQPIGIQLMRLQAQLDTLLAVVLTEDQRVDFELSFEGQIADSLAEVEHAVPAMKLKAPMPPPSANGAALFMPPGFRPDRRN